MRHWYRLWATCRPAANNHWWGREQPFETDSTERDAKWSPASFGRLPQPARVSHRARAHSTFSVNFFPSRHDKCLCWFYKITSNDSDRLPHEHSSDGCKSHPVVYQAPRQRRRVVKRKKMQYFVFCLENQVQSWCDITYEAWRCSSSPLSIKFTACWLINAHTQVCRWPLGHVNKGANNETTHENWLLL